MKKFLNFLFYVLLTSLLVIISQYDEILPLLNEVKQSEGFALAFVSFFKNFFKNATFYQYFAVIIFTCVSGYLFILLENLLPVIFVWLSSRFKWLGFTSKGWFDYVRKGFGVFIVFSLIIIVSNIIVINYSQSKIVDNIDEITEPRPTVILGTSRKYKSGVNEYFKNRIDAGLELWKAGKVKYFIVSGDKNDSTDYNETRDMKNDLMAAGVPANRIKIDPKGFRTLDSVVRLLSEFKINEMIMVTQEFHLNKGLFLAWYYDVDAVGYAAKGSATMKSFFRETGAKPWMLADVYLRNTQPSTGAYKHVNDFEANTNTDAWLLILMVFTVVLMGVIFVRQLFQRTKGMKLAMGTAGISLTAVVLLTSAAYRSDVVEFEPLNYAVEAFAETTSIGESLVTKKKERVEIKANMEAIKEELEAIKEVEDEVYQPITELVVTEVIYPEIIEEEEEVLDYEDISDEVKEFFVDDKIVNIDVKSIKEIPKAEEIDVFATMGDDSEDDSGFFEDESVRMIFKGAINGTHLVANNERIEIRIKEEIFVDNTVIKVNKIIPATVNIIGDRVHISYFIGGHEGVVKDVFDEEGFALEDMEVDKSGRVIFSDGMSFNGQI